jgi:hypothetical protein
VTKEPAAGALPKSSLFSSRGGGGPCGHCSSASRAGWRSDPPYLTTRWAQGRRGGDDVQVVIRHAGGSVIILGDDDVPGRIPRRGDRRADPLFRAHGGEGIPAFCRTGEGHPVFGIRWCFDRRMRDERIPAFCRTGEGHPVFGRRWCVERGYGLGSVRDGDLRTCPPCGSTSMISRQSGCACWDSPRPALSPPLTGTDPKLGRSGDDHAAVSLPPRAVSRGERATGGWRSGSDSPGRVGGMSDARRDESRRASGVEMTGGGFNLPVARESERNREVNRAECRGSLGKVVGARGFEPPTPRSRTERSTKLSHTPAEGFERFYTMRGSG